MNAIDKLTAKVNRIHEKIEEDITVIRKTMTELSLFFSSPSLIYFKHSSQSWSSIVSFGGVHDHKTEASHQQERRDYRTLE